MKTKLSLMLGSLLLLSQVAMAQTYNVSANVPAGSGVSIAVNSVTGTSSSPVFTPVSGSTLSYGTLSFNSATSVYLASNYFTFDVTVNGGSGSPNTTVSWSDQSTPGGAANGLGKSSSVAFDKEVYAGPGNNPTQTPLTVNSATSQNLDDGNFSSGNVIPFTDVAPGWLRIYMGLCTGNTSSANGTVDPSGCVPFNSASVSGTYSGNLTVSATVN